MMEKKVFKYVEENRLFAGVDNVITALSGGADSMALFHFLYSWQDKLCIRLSAAHFNHGLRGDESDRDADFVREVCAKYGVPLYIHEAHMAQAERPAGFGVEAWGRDLRYAFFLALAREHNALIATAHTLSDNAETVLFNAVRGAGVRGLSGIPPRRDVFVRPLLAVSRQEVEDYCHAQGLSFVTDSTNMDLQYSRNRIRHVALPALEAAHAGAERALGRLAGDMRALDAYIQNEAMALLNRATHKNGHCAAVLREAAEPVRRRALLILAGFALDHATLERLEEVLCGKSGRLQLTNGFAAFVYDGLFFIEQRKEEQQPAYAYEIMLHFGEIELPGGYRLCVEMTHSPENLTFSQKKGEKGFTFVADYAKITRNSVFRTRKPTDCYAPAGRGVTKTLKKWMNEQKIPQPLRAQLPLLCEGNRVLWVWDAGFCEGLYPTKTTEQFLCLHQG